MCLLPILYKKYSQTIFNISIIFATFEEKAKKNLVLGAPGVQKMHKSTIGAPKTSFEDKSYMRALSLLGVYLADSLLPMG